MSSKDEFLIQKALFCIPRWEPLRLLGLLSILRLLVFSERAVKSQHNNAVLVSMVNGIHKGKLKKEQRKRLSFRNDGHGKPFLLLMSEGYWYQIRVRAALARSVL